MQQNERLTLLTPIVPEDPWKSGVKGMPTLTHALMKAFDAFDTVLKYPMRTGPADPRSEAST